MGCWLQWIWTLGTTSTNDSIAWTLVPSLNTPPNVTASTNMTFHAGDLTTFSAYIFDVDDDNLSINWTLISSPLGSTLPSALSTMSAFVISADLVGTYSIQLLVSDQLTSVINTISVIATNTAPSANAGTNRIFPVFSLVELSALNSTDNEDDTLTYTWAILDKPASSNQIISPNNLITTSVLLDSIGTYDILLAVSDNWSISTTSITIKSVPPFDPFAPTYSIRLSHQNVSSHLTVMISFNETMIASPLGIFIDYDTGASQDITSQGDWITSNYMSWIATVTPSIRAGLIATVSVRLAYGTDGNRVSQGNSKTATYYILPYLVTSNTATGLTVDVDLPYGAVSVDVTPIITFFSTIPSTDTIIPSKDSATSRSIVWVTYLDAFEFSLAPTGSYIGQPTPQIQSIANFYLSFAGVSSTDKLVRIYTYSASADRWSEDGIISISITRDNVCFTTAKQGLFALVLVEAEPIRSTENLVISRALSAPNPFNPGAAETSHIGFYLNKAATIKLFVHNIAGSVIYSDYASFNDGYNEFVWNGRDLKGRIVGNDLYFAYIVAAAGNSKVVKIVVMK